MQKEIQRKKDMLKYREEQQRIKLEDEAARAEANSELQSDDEVLSQMMLEEFGPDWRVLFP